jgi:hypothetical protein
MTERSWVQTPTVETILQAHLLKTLIVAYAVRNLANGRVDFEEWSACKIQLHGTE